MSRFDCMSEYYQFWYRYQLNSLAKKPTASGKELAKIRKMAKSGVVDSQNLKAVRELARKRAISDYQLQKSL